MAETLRGLIVKGIGGFYYVEVADSVYECRARGIFRKENVVPTVGDWCRISGGDGKMYMVESIEERKNILARPPLANIDKLFIVVACAEPSPNALVIDRLAACAEDRGIEPVLVFTKLDLASDGGFSELYSAAGFKTVRIDYESGEGIRELREELRDCVSGFAGNTGVGKSTLLNAVEPGLSLATGEISKKLGRGRHTTRSCELYPLSFGGKIADTPGFSSFDSEFIEVIDKERLPDCFREFEEHIGQCRFTSCSHVCEKGCAVIEAVGEGKIAKSRHESYCTMYEEAKKKKEWL